MMGKRRLVFAFVLWLLVAAMVIIATLFAVKYFRDDYERRHAPQQAPAETPIVPPPQPEAPKQKEPDKPKELIKPPKKPEPQAKVEEDMTGKVRLCPNSREAVAVASDGRLLGHYPYADANGSDLGSAPSGFGGANCSMLHGEAKLALEQMMEGARASDPAVADAMVGLSCFRSAQYQREVFCRKVGDGLAARARASAPPGYSEHATGYVIDFGDRNNPQCNLNGCFSTTPVGEWLSANAGKYGFVLSFPKGNGQDVMYEPWHWRYQGSPAAQTVFVGKN